MDQIPLIGGSYVARSVIANAQRCINYFPESNTKDAMAPVTHYQRPGLRPLATPTLPGSGRGVFRASNGNGYAVVGTTVYAVGPAPNWTLTQIGEVTPSHTNPCKMTDNGTTALLVDGSTSGWTIDLASNAFAPVDDTSGLFTGASFVDVIDGFMIWNVITSVRNFASTLDNTSFPTDPLYIAGKNIYPDPLQALIVNRHEILLIGTVRSEIWYDAGNAGFPFAVLPGAYIEHGTCAPYSVAAQDISVYWLGQNQQGSGQVFRQRGYETKRISNFALEYAIRQMKATSTINDAVAYIYQQDGHVFYVLSFPSGNETWVYDEATEEWHQRCWTDSEGNLNRDRTMSHAFLSDTNVVMDWQNGTLYALDLNVYTDTVGGNAGAISFIRSFPHWMAGMDPAKQQAVRSNNRRVIHNVFQADLECGMDPTAPDGTPAVVGLRWSDDRGRTWGNTVLQSAGSQGQFLTSPQWRLLGLARDRVYEISHNIAGPAALNGAWVGTTLENT